MWKEFLFPAPCLHCEVMLKDPSHFLCENCVTLLPWIDANSRCSKCFLETCACSSLRLPLHRRLAVFSYGGPAEILISKFKFQGLQQLTELFASCLLLQIEKAELKWPDLIIPIPHAPWHSLFRGYLASELLAKSLAKKMGVPFTRALRRTLVSIPQRCKTKEQRKSLSEQTYRLRRGIDLTDRNILLIDDVSTTGTTLARCADALRGCFASQVSACTLAIVDPIL